MEAFVRESDEERNAAIEVETLFLFSLVTISACARSSLALVLSD